MYYLKGEWFYILAPLILSSNDCIKIYARATANGEVSEWSMVQSWKDCVGAIPPGVRIPSSPYQRLETLARQGFRAFYMLYARR